MRMNIGPANDDRKMDYTYEGVKFILKASDPYGFVKVTDTKKSYTLDEIFTDFEAAKKGIQKYMLNSKKPKEKTD